MCGTYLSGVNLHELVVINLPQTVFQMFPLNATAEKLIIVPYRTLQFGTKIMHRVLLSNDSIKCVPIFLMLLSPFRHSSDRLVR